jgi:hypothetical protein
MCLAQVHERACMPATHPLIEGTERGTERPCVGDCSLLMYAAAGRPTIVGEWSLATNMDAPIDVSRPEVAAHLGRLYREQLEVFARSPAVMGAFFWTLRMGSGWDPRPTDAHPHGQQVDGTSAWRSKPGYPFPVWSLLEMAELGVATPLDADYAGACA